MPQGQNYEHQSWKLLGKILIMSGFELILAKVKIIVVNELNEPLRSCNFFLFVLFLLETNCIFYGEIVLTGQVFTLWTVFNVYKPHSSCNILWLDLTKEKTLTDGEQVGRFCSNVENPQDLVLVCDHSFSSVLCDKRERIWIWICLWGWWGDSVFEKVSICACVALHSS